MNVYIGNLANNTSEDKLKNIFEEFGQVQSIKVTKDRFSGVSKGYGFIEMPSNSEADQAIKTLNGNRVDGNNIKIKPADSGGKKRNKRPFRKRNY
jgi:RNA recognition motif-containing protein